MLQNRKPVHMGRPLIDITGHRIGKWTVLKFHGFRHKTRSLYAMWSCRCECGTERSVLSWNLRNGTSVDCGCGRYQRLLQRNTKHGIYGTPLYWTLYGNLKRARRLQAMPKWANEDAMQAFYASRPKGHDVDHIVPLTSKLVCGLHWEGNLQYLPKSVNQSKKNRYWPDMPEA